MQFLIDIALSLIYFCAFLLLCAWAWRFWKMYINQRYLNKTNSEYIMLEIKLPREIFKSPYATEVAISSLLQGGGIGTWYHKNYLGNLPIYSSLEIASIEGIIHFYIRVQGKFKSLVESNFYAQYPGIEIVEADDYTKALRYSHLSKDVGCWGVTYGLSETWGPKDLKETGESLQLDGEPYKMPADFLPLKTYTDYGLDKDPKEEFKIDPITPLLEMMGSMKKGEQLWFQIILQDESVYNGKKKFPKFYVNKVTHEHVSLSDMSEQFKKQTRTAGFIKKGDPVKDDAGEVKTKTVTKGVDSEGKPRTETVDITYKENKLLPKREMELTMEEKFMVEAANKKFAKPLAVVVMRMLYMVDNKVGKFDAQNIQNTLAFPKPFAGANSLAPKKVTDPYDYPWQKMGGRQFWRAEEMFEAYVEREGFYPHIVPRPNLDRFEDRFFFTSTMKTRRTWRMFYEAIFHPFTHPQPADAFTLNLEEIATIWHLPGAVATTPTLPRIDSAKGVAPVDLPQ
jgi:hypothetical protein